MKKMTILPSGIARVALKVVEIQEKVKKHKQPDEADVARPELVFSASLTGLL
jgi:hypothetical protein